MKKNKLLTTLFLGVIVTLIVFGSLTICKETIFINSDPPGIGGIINLVVHG